MSAAQDKDAAPIIRCHQCGKRNRVAAIERGIPRCAACHTSLPWLVEATAASFDRETRASVPVLVDLWAPWCGPCHMMAPVLEGLARERAGRLKVVKLDVDQAPAISARHRVQGIPLLILMRDGREVARLTGAVPPAKLTAWLDGQLGQDAVTGRRRAG